MAVFSSAQHESVGIRAGNCVRFYTNLSVASNLKWVGRSFLYDNRSYSLKTLMSKFILSVLIKFYFFVFIAIPTLYRYMFRHSLSQSDETQILN